MKKTILLCAIIALTLGQTFAQDSILYVMKPGQKAKIAQNHSELVRLVKNLYSEIKAKNLPLQYNTLNGDTAYWYQYKNVRIGQDGKWLTIADFADSTPDSTGNYYTFEGHNLQHVTNKTGKDQEIEFNYLQALNNENAIMADHYHAEKSTWGDYKVYAHDGYIKNAYGELTLCMSNFKSVLSVALQDCK